MQFINLTPHTINVYRGDDVILSIPSSGYCRVATTQESVGELDGIPVVKTRYGEVEGLPPPKKGTTYIVSAMALQVVGHCWNDVVAPNTSPESAVRNDKGEIIGVRSFVVA
jgi:hypothetical protein